MQCIIDNTIDFETRKVGLANWACHLLSKISRTMPCTMFYTTTPYCQTTCILEEISYGLLRYAYECDWLVVCLYFNWEIKINEVVHGMSRDKYNDPKSLVG